MTNHPGSGGLAPARRTGMNDTPTDDTATPEPETSDPGTSDTAIYTVTSLSGVPGLMYRPLDEAEEYAQRISERNADRYIAYAVYRNARTLEPGETVSVWVRGTKCEPDQLPRAEFRDRRDVVAMVPVVDGNELWSVRAAERFHHGSFSDTSCEVVLVNKAGKDVRRDLWPDGKD